MIVYRIKQFKLKFLIRKANTMLHEVSGSITKIITEKD